jgi:hypothetical protein
MCWVGLLQQVLMLLLQLCNRQEMECTVQQQEHTVRLLVPFERSDSRCCPVIDFFITAP